MKTKESPPTRNPPHMSWFTLGTYLLAFCGKGGDQGVYRLLRNKPGAKWEYCPPMTREWDIYHQAAFRGSKADAANPSRLENIPVLPSTFPPPHRIWVDHPPRVETPRSSGESWREVIEAGGELQVWIVLEEDTYETHHGDGCFREFSGAFRTAADAKKAASRSALHPHIRKARLVVKADQLSLVIDSAESTHFDHVTLKQVCDALEGSVAGASLRKKSGRKKVSR
ncbi:MAG: hypothetical protein AAB074_11010 [Planctomycetota bacterium]